MERRLVLALSLAAILIGGATWFRLARTQNPFTTLTVVNTAAADDSSTSATSLIPQDDASTTASTSTESLTTTDLIGRQYVIDYLNLAADGQATDANISTLGDNLAANLSTLFTYTPIDASALSVTDDSKANMQAYSDEVSAIYSKYQAKTASLMASGGDLSDTSSPNFQKTLNALGGYYASAAKELEAVPTPSSLEDLHLKLVNNYLSTAQALSAVGNANNDAATAYSALNAAGANSADEANILLQIHSDLAVSGISSFSAGQ